MGSLTLLLGGARSGKSRHAQQWAEERGARVLFIATAQAFDDEMRDRILRHQQERPAGWVTLEAPLQVAAAVAEAFAAPESEGTSFDTVVLDCMTLLTSNILLAQAEEADVHVITGAVLEEVESLLALVRTHSADWLVVTNEVGMGIVPATRMGRDYRDALGAANQRLAAAADALFLFVAGLPWRMK